MKNERILDYMTGYQDQRPRGRTRFLFWGSLGIHGVVLGALIVVPLTHVDRDFPRFESMSTFLVRPAAPPPPPPPPPPPAMPRGGESAKPNRPRMDAASFISPMAVPTSIPMEDFGAREMGVLGGIEGGIPGGVVGGIVGGLSAEPPPPTENLVRLDSRREEARPIVRVEPVYPDLAAKARVQGVVVLEVMVNEEGFPAEVRVLRGVPLLDSAAVAAVREWRWKPYLMLDRAVPFWVTVTVSFRLT